MKKIWLTVCAVLAAGSMTAAFAACNTTDGEDEHEHNLSFVAAVDATCTEDGHKAYYECDGCDKIFADAEGENEITLDSTVVEALGHDVEQVAAVEATCTTDGNIAYYECKVCHELFEDEEATKPIDEADTVIAAKHDFINVPAKEATCTAEGNIAYYECKVCHELFKDADATEGIEKEDTVVAKKAHTPETIPGKAATCTETGLTDGSKCSVCGTILKEQEVISANGHSPAAAVKENEKAATCTAQGSYDEVVYCSVCHAEISRAEKTTPKAAHDLNAVAEKAATCTMDGNIAYYECKTCHELFEDEEATKPIDKADTVIAAKHDLVNVPAKDATCTAEGNIAYYECKVCHELFKDADATEGIEKEDTVVAKKAHTPETIPGKAATCTETGLTDGSKCSVCGTILEEQEIISANGHTMVLVEAAEPTCTEYGHTAYYECSVCKEYYSSDAEGKNEITLDSTVAGEPNGHSEELTVRVGTAPTATADGTYEYVCPDCQGVVKTEAIPALTQDNVDNEVYTLVETYTYNASRRVYVCTSEYTLAESKTGEPLVFEITRNIRGTAFTSFPKTYSTSGSTAAKNFNEITGGYLISGEAGWYEITINTADVFMSATVINSDGTMQTLEFMPDSNSCLFECKTSTSAPSIVVFHNYTTEGTTARTISFTIAKSEILMIGVGEAVQLPNMLGGNAASQESGGGSVTLMVAEDVPEGTYQLKLSNSNMLGRYYNFSISVNGENVAQTTLNNAGGLGAVATIQVKAGDVIVITNNNYVAMTLKATLTAL